MPSHTVPGKSAHRLASEQAGLEKRGCQVLRLNTYDTVPARSLAEEDLQLASAAKVLTVASPSAMSAWQHHSQNDDLDNRKVACIGKHPGPSVFYSDSLLIVLHERLAILSQLLLVSTQSCQSLH